MTQPVETLPELPPGIYGFYGRPGTLKTSIALSFPGKIKMYDFDLGAHRGWEFKKSLESGQLIHKEMPLPVKSITKRSSLVEGCSEMWEQFIRDYTESMENPEIKTVIIDTATNEWTLCADAYLQELQRFNPTRKQLIQIEFREPNQRQKMLFSAPRVYKKKLVLVMHETDERVPLMYNGQPVLDQNGQQQTTMTGRKIPDGFRQTIGLADWIFYTDVEERVEGKEKKQVPSVTIEKSAAGIDLVGMKLEWFTYKMLQQLLVLKHRL